MAVRTGDTAAAERAAMLKRPPDFLITTPESLYLLVTADRTRAMLAPVAGRSSWTRSTRSRATSGARTWR